MLTIETTGELSAEFQTHFRIEHGGRGQLHGVASGREMGANVWHRRDATYADEPEPQTVLVNCASEESDLFQGRFTNRVASDPSPLAVEQRTLVFIDDRRGDAVHHHQRVGVWRESVCQLGGKRFVGHVPDFDEQRS